MRVPAALVLLLFVPMTACGGGDDSGQCAGAACAAGGTAGGGGASGASATGGVGNGGSANGGSGAIAGGGAAGGGGSPSDACSAIGGTLTGTQACYVRCTYDGSLVPNYDRNGDCTKFASKCGRYNYCLPNITCTADKNCGTGRVCVLGGECQIGCATDADCPTPASGAPLQCKPVDTGTLVCRPYP